MVHRVLELADVPRPPVRQELHGGIVGQLRPRDAETRGVGRQEMAREREEIERAVAEWSDGEGRDVEAVVEVLAETPLRHRMLQVRVRRRDEANVHRDRAPRPDAHDLPLLEHAEQLHLRLEREIADLVEEERPAVRSLEPARLARERARERALLVTEQLALEERRRQRAAVDGDER